MLTCYHAGMVHANVLACCRQAPKHAPWFLLACLRRCHACTSLGSCARYAPMAHDTCWFTRLNTGLSGKDTALVGESVIALSLPRRDASSQA